LTQLVTGVALLADKKAKPDSAVKQGFNVFTRLGDSG
jgi:hypothetical protein